MLLGHSSQPCLGDRSPPPLPAYCNRALHWDSRPNPQQNLAFSCFVNVPTISTSIVDFLGRVKHKHSWVPRPKHTIILHLQKYHDKVDMQLKRVACSFLLKSFLKQISVYGKINTNLEHVLVC